jgi:pimeloyl-ACP methyl ester carboxylesterase
MSHERMIQANGVELCVETFGDPNDPPILLVMGAAGSMDAWEDEFCEQLAAGSRHVIRYDNRDTGRSTSYEPGNPAYTFDDLVEDAVGLLDVLGVQRAHVVGVSMGGSIGQTLALRHPERLATLTLLAASPAVDIGRELPPMSEELRDLFDSPPPPPEWSDRDAVIRYLVSGEEPFLGSVRGADETKRAIAGRVFDRTSDVAASQTNHWILGGEDLDASIAEIAVPTLVFHGTEDPLFPLPHGEALADAIPDARLVRLEGVGHEVPPKAVWDMVIPALLRHTDPTRKAAT